MSAPDFSKVTPEMLESIEQYQARVRAGASEKDAQATRIRTLVIVIDADGQHVRIGDREFVIVPGEEQRITFAQEVEMTWNVVDEESRPVGRAPDATFDEAGEEPAEPWFAEAHRLHAAAGCYCETKPWCVPHGRDSRFSPPCAPHGHVDPATQLDEAEAMVDAQLDELEGTLRRLDPELVRDPNEKIVELRLRPLEERMRNAGFSQEDIDRVADPPPCQHPNRIWETRLFTGGLGPAMRTWGWSCPTDPGPGCGRGESTNTLGRVSDEFPAALR